MRLTWLKKLIRLVHTHPPLRAGPKFAVAQDLLKLLAYAIVSGIAFSALAIGVVLAVSRDSEANDIGHQSTGAVWVDWPNPPVVPAAAETLPQSATAQRHRTNVAGVSSLAPPITAGEKF